MISWPDHEYSYPVTEDQPAGSPPAWIAGAPLRP